MLSVEDVYGNSAVTAQSIQQSDSPPESSLPPSPTSSTSSAALIDEQQLVNKITWRLIPFIGWLYMLSFLDRVNLANVHGTILQDLHMSETDYSHAVGIFFLGYCLFEIPSNLIMQRVQPRVWIARILITWGGITCLLAACRNRDALITLRFFLGVAEAGFFPGMVFYLTLWFTPSELSSRIAMFFCTSAVAGVLGGLISYGVLHLEGLWGLHGWQLLFLVEGIPSVLSGFLTYFYLPNEPMDCDFLTPEEQQCAVDRLAHARQIPVANQETIPAEQLQKKKISWEDLRNTLLDWRVWALSFLYLNILITLYSLSFFLPAIIGQFGYSVLKSNLLSVPIYAFAGVVTIFVSMSSDRRNERFLHCAIPGFIGALCFALMSSAIDQPDITPKFILLMVLVATCWCLVPPILALLMSLLKSATSSATGSAFCVSFGNIGGYLGPAICAWSQTTSKSYSSACIVFSCCLIIMSVGMLLLRHRLRSESDNPFSAFSFVSQQEDVELSSRTNQEPKQEQLQNTLGTVPEVHLSGFAALHTTIGKQIVHA